MRISDWSSDVCSSDLEHLLHLLADQRVEVGLAARIGFERRIAPGLADRTLQHLLRIHLPAIVEGAHQDEQEQRRGHRELDQRGAALVPAQAAQQGGATTHCDNLSFEICRAIAWKFSFSSSESSDS